MNASNLSIDRANRVFSLRHNFEGKASKSISASSSLLSNEVENLFSTLISSNQNISLPLYSKNSKDFVKIVIGDSNFQEIIIGTISSSENPTLIINLLNALSLILPRTCEDNIISLIDLDLPFALINLLESNNENLIISILSFIGSTVSYSDYARDCYLNFGIISSLISLIQFPSLIEPICVTLCSFFNHPAPLEHESIVEFVKPLVEFIAVVSKPIIKIILSTLYKMYLKSHLIIFTFYEMKIHILVVEMLNDATLVEEAIEVIGALCNAEPIYVKSLIELNLIQKLFELYNQNYLNSLFRGFSNLFESAFKIVQPYFNFEFCINSAFLALQSSSQVKIEVSLFISKIILFSDRHELSKFIDTHIIELFTNVLNYNDEESVLFYLHAIQRLIQNQVSDGKHCNIFQSSDLYDAVEDLSQSEMISVSSFSRVLLNFIQ
jgi:hypothetical protein